MPNKIGDHLHGGLAGRRGLLIVAAILLGMFVAIGVQWAADRLAEGLSDKLELISSALEEISESHTGLNTPSYLPRPERTIAAEPGTSIAHVYRTKDSRFEIGYAPVLAFVETYDDHRWDVLALIDGSPQVRDCVVERVLLPGQSLTVQDCAEMKQRHADENPVEVRFAAQQREENP